MGPEGFRHRREIPLCHQLNAILNLPCCLLLFACEKHGCSCFKFGHNCVLVSIPSGLYSARPSFMCFFLEPSQTLGRVFQEVWSQPCRHWYVSSLDPVGVFQVCPGWILVHIFQAWPCVDSGSCVSGLDSTGPWFKMLLGTAGPRFLCFRSGPSCTKPRMSPFWTGWILIRVMYVWLVCRGSASSWPRFTQTSRLDWSTTQFQL